MFIRRLFAVVLLGSMAVSLAAAEEEKQLTRAAPEQVVLTLPSDHEAVEFCTALGELKAKSGMGYGDGEKSVRSTTRQRAAAMGANVVQMRPPALSGLMIMSGNGTAYRCSEEALAKQKAKAAEIARQAEELERRASEPVVCEAGADCELKPGPICRSNDGLELVEKTIISYDQSVRTFFTWLEQETEVKALTEVSPDTLASYQMALLCGCAGNGDLSDLSRRIETVRSIDSIRGQSGLLQRDDYKPSGIRGHYVSR